MLSAFPVALLVGGASIAFMTASTSIVQTRAEPQMRGRVLALQAMVVLGSTPIGGPLLGRLCDTYGARFGLVVGGVACLAAASWGIYAARQLGHPDVVESAGGGTGRVRLAGGVAGSASA